MEPREGMSVPAPQGHAICEQVSGGPVPSPVHPSAPWKEALGGPVSPTRRRRTEGPATRRPMHCYRRPACRGPCRASSALRPCLAPPDQFSPGAAEGRPAHQAAADAFSPSLRSSASAHPHCRGAPRSSGYSGTSRASHVCRLLSFCLKSREGSDTDEVTEAQTEPGVLCSWPPDISFPGPHHQLTGWGQAGNSAPFNRGEGAGAQGSGQGGVGKTEGENIRGCAPNAGGQAFCRPPPAADATPGL